MSVQLIRARIAGLLLIFPSSPVMAVTALTDGEMAAVQGAGIGLVLQHYQLDIAPESYWRLGTSGTSATLVFDQFWWCPSNGNTPIGSSACSGDGSATLGRTDDPFYFDIQEHSGLLRDGSQGSRAALSLAAPQQTLAQDYMDAGYRFSLEHPGLHDDVTRLTARGMDIDGSYIRLWSEPQLGTLPALGIAWSANLKIMLDSLHLRVNEDSMKPYPAFGDFLFGTCPHGVTACGPSVDWRGFEYNYQIGRDFYQPVTLRTLADGNIEFELNMIPANSSIYTPFYESPKGHVRIASLIANWDGTGTPPENQWEAFEDTNSCAAYNLLLQCTDYHDDFRQMPGTQRVDAGYSRIEGIQIQYLRVRTLGL